MSEEETSKELEEFKKERWLYIFSELSKSERFKHFVEDNFNITDNIDHEKQEITTLIVEKPVSVGPPITNVQKAQMLLILNSLVNKLLTPQSAADRIYSLLGQEASPILSLDSAKIVTDPNVKIKLD